MAAGRSRSGWDIPAPVPLRRDLSATIHVKAARCLALSPLMAWGVSHRLRKNHMAKRLTPSPTVRESANQHGRELRAIRQHLGMSQRECATRLGVHSVSLSKWERGTKSVPLTVLYLARFLVLSSTPPSAFLPMVSTRDLPLMTLSLGRACLGYGSDCQGQCYTLEALLSRRRGLEARACTAHLPLAYETMVRALTSPSVKQRHWTRRKRASSHDENF